MKCALHVHTNFSDGLHSPEEMIQAYRDRGFKCVAITDHKFMLPANYYNYLELLGGKTKREMMILAGAEEDYEPWSNHHLLQIEGDKDTLRVLCHPRAYLLSPEQIKDRIENAGVKVDAIEVSYRGFYTPEYNVSQIPFPKIATDDSHELYDIARCWIETENFKSPDRLFKAIRSSDFEIKMA